MLLDYKHTDNNHFRNRLENIVEPVQQYMSQLDSYLVSQEACFEPEIRELTRYCMKHSGKRLRPLLVFAAGYTPEQNNQELVKVAAIIEMVHLATLVHDDILDDADIRHRTETANRKFGTNVAVLLGDAFFSQALKLAAEFETPKVCHAIAEATRRVCAGEIGQTFQRGNDSTSIEDYYRSIELKTAELFRVSANLGADIADQDERFVAAAAEFGRRLGIAYQIFDDIADVLGEEERLGKTLGTDLASGKYTLPVIYLLNELDAKERFKLLANLQAYPESTSDLLVKFRRFEILPKVCTAFHDELDAADASLNLIEDAPPASLLKGMSAFLRQQIYKYLDQTGVTAIA